jgi:hypothetical protein
MTRHADADLRETDSTGPPGSTPPDATIPHLSGKP